MSEYTKGPWVADVSVNDRGGWESPTQFVVIGNGENIVAMYETNYAEYPDDEQNVANARLIASAPDLLEALLWMVENDDTYEGDTPLPDHSGATWNEINAFWIAGLNKARAAIAKARGEQP